MPEKLDHRDALVSTVDGDFFEEVRRGGQEFEEVEVEEFEEVEVEEDEEELEDAEGESGEYGGEEEVEDVDEEEHEDEDGKDEQAEDMLTEVGNGEEEDVEEAEEEEGEDGEELAVEEVKEKSCGTVVEDMIDDGEEMDVEEESDSKRQVEASIDAAELAASVLEDAEDVSVTLKSGENDKDQNPVSSTDSGGSAEKHLLGPSKMFSKCSEVFTGGSVGNRNCTIAATEVPSKENGKLKALEGETFKRAQHENERANNAPKNVKHNDIKADGSHCSGSDNSRYTQLQDNDLAVEDTTKNKSKIVKHVVAELCESDSPQISNSRMMEGVNLTCAFTPHSRQRSSSPCTEMVKKQAITCVYYARGWCIKGSSCTFLHQDGINKVEPQAVEDKAGKNRQLESLGTPGAKEIVEGSKVSALMLDPSNAEGPPECNSLLQRALVRAYGPGTQISSQFHEEYNNLGNGKFQQLGDTHTGESIVQEECWRPSGKMVESKFSDSLLSTSCLLERKPVNGMPSKESSYEKTFSGTHMMDASLPEHITFLCSSSESSTLHLSSNSLSTYGRIGDFASKSAHGQLPNPGSYTSHNFSSISSGMSSSFQLAQLDHGYSRVGASPNCGSNQNTRYVQGQTVLDFDREHYGSRSISFMRDSSPYPLSHESQESSHHHIISANTPSAWQNTKTGYDAWEPSQRFRPSLAIAGSGISAPGSQYDPILDSIEPAGSHCRAYSFQASKMTSFDSTSFLPSDIDTILHGSGNAVSQTFDGTPVKNLALQYSSGDAVANVFTGPSMLELGNRSTQIEKVRNPDQAIERSSFKSAGLRSQAGKGRNNRESKAFKIFQAALVEFMKELVKPLWREGHLSKDAHKTILKKSVEKVLSALQPQQVPSTQETINQYLTASKPKLQKLVEGYVQKYANS